MLEIFILLIVFQIKHFICDYPLQTQYMLGKGNKTGWAKPLLCHAGVHSMFTALIAMWYLIIIGSPLLSTIIAPSLALLDFAIHFSVDRIKASPYIGGRFKPDQPYFWWALGADQMAHHLTHYAFIAILIGVS